MDPSSYLNSWPVEVASSADSRSHSPQWQPFIAILSQSPPVTRTLHALHGACTRYGPGRLPGADRPDIGAGYAAASAALAATALVAAVIVAPDVFAQGASAAGGVLFFGFALPFVLPAAFAVGVLGWRLLPSHRPIAGVALGALGTLATYVLASLLLGVAITVGAALSLTGADPASAALFTVGVLAIAVVATGWLTVPLGGLAGFLYVTAVETDPVDTDALDGGPV